VYQQRGGHELGEGSVEGRQRSGVNLVHYRSYIIKPSQHHAAAAGGFTNGANSQS
jgi:hypothetical protein